MFTPRILSDSSPLVQPMHPRPHHGTGTARTSTGKLLRRRLHPLDSEPCLLRPKSQRRTSVPFVIESSRLAHCPTLKPFAKRTSTNALEIIARMEALAHPRKEKNQQPRRWFPVERACTFTQQQKRTGRDTHGSLGVSLSIS
jgi:hypothetical protein